MSWISNTLTSSLGRKVLMALTGLFLCSFLAIHLIGNLQLLIPDDGIKFNEYAYFMTHNPLIKTTSYLLYGSILLHMVSGYLLIVKNRKARPVGYAMVKQAGLSSWASRNMGILGTFVLIFIIVHMKQFWYEMHWGNISVDSNGYKNLYQVVSTAYQEWWWVLFYVLSMVGLAYHLLHGFQSGFQTLGLTHPKYSPFVKLVGAVFAIIIPVAFAAIPIIMYVQSMG